MEEEMEYEKLNYIDDLIGNIQMTFPCMIVYDKEFDDLNVGGVIFKTDF